MAFGSVILICPFEHYLVAAAKSSDFQCQTSPSHRRTLAIISVW